MFVKQGENLTLAFNLTTADAANNTLLPSEVIYLEDEKWKHIVETADLIAEK